MDFVAIWECTAGIDLEGVMSGMEDVSLRLGMVLYPEFRRRLVEWAIEVNFLGLARTIGTLTPH